MHVARWLLAAIPCGKVALGAAVLAATACLPLADLEGYTSGSGEPGDGVDTSTGSLEDDPAALGGELDEGEAPLGGEEVPGDDGEGAASSGDRPIDPTLSNAEPPATGGASNDGETSAEPPPAPPAEEAPAEPPAEEQPPAEPEPCADGVLNPAGNTCYFVSTELASWPDARAACQAWGGDLARLNSPFEDAFVGGLAPFSVWLGASDIAQDNVFTWIDGLPIVPPGNWGPGQPDLFPGQDCMEKRQEPFNERWYDIPCTTQLNFVCEKPVPPPSGATTGAAAPL